MPSARVWTLAGVAGVVVFVWSLLAAGVTYDERRVRIETVTAELAKTPNDIGAWNRLASLIVNAEESDKVFERWRRRAPQALLEEEAGEAMLLYRMGSRLSSEAEAEAFARTIELLDAFTSEHSEQAGPHHWHTLALAYRQMDEPDKALAACAQTEASAAPLVRENPTPHLAIPLYWLGRTRHELGDAEGGRRGWALLVQLMDQTGELRDQGRQYDWESMSQAALDAGDKETAVECLVRYESQLQRASRFRDSIQHWRDLGWRWRRAGEEGEAKRVWGRAAELQAAQVDADPDPNAWYNLACYWALAGQKERALQAWRGALNAGWSAPAFANGDEDLDAIRDEPEFAQSMIELTRRLLASGRASESEVDMLYILARYQAVAGNTAGALSSLVKAYDAGFLGYTTLRDDPFFAPLADRADFRALSQKIKARYEAWQERLDRRDDRDDEEGERT